MRELTDTQILGIAPVSTIKGGNNQGTAVAWQLVYAYAEWISPKAHLQVIEAFARSACPCSMARCAFFLDALDFP